MAPTEVIELTWRHTHGDFDALCRKIMSGKEILTLQLGHYANFVGAHWWNLQVTFFLVHISMDFVVVFTRQITPKALSDDRDYLSITSLHDLQRCDRAQSLTGRRRIDPCSRRSPSSSQPCFQKIF